MSEMLLRQGRGAVQSGDSWSLFLLSWTLGTGSQADAKAAEPSDSGPRLQLSECRKYIWIKPSAMVTSLLRPCLRGKGNEGQSPWGRDCPPNMALLARNQ